MRTEFTAAQLRDPILAEANSILRKCVHCGFCNSACPTFSLLGDELDSPRGRIYLIKELLENQRQPSDKVVQHIDRCLSCFACMSACPSGVDYLHLADTGRAYIQSKHKRSLADWLMRQLLAYMLPRPAVLRMALLAAPLLRLFRFLLPARLRQAEELLQGKIARRRAPVVQIKNAQDTVALLSGCVQSVLGRDINQASVDILRRHNINTLELSGCCGAIEQHLGKTAVACARIKDNLTHWRQADISALLVNASGCGTQLKDYGHIMQHDQAYAGRARQLAAKTKDISEYLHTQTLRFDAGIERLRIGYHSPCSMQHAQKVHKQPIALLRQAGFAVSPLPEAHLCCGSAGTYNLLQPALSQQLVQRKAALINALELDAVATANLGCLLQLRPHVGMPIVHIISLLNWATGGTKPPQLR